MSSHKFVFRINASNWRDARTWLLANCVHCDVIGRGHERQWVVEAHFLRARTADELFAIPGCTFVKSLAPEEDAFASSIFQDGDIRFTPDLCASESLGSSDTWSSSDEELLEDDMESFIDDQPLTQFSQEDISLTQLYD